MLSLLIYQGLTTGEIVRIRVQDVDLDNGELWVRPSRTVRGRTMELLPRQYRIIDQYLAQRELLRKVDTDVLLIGKLGTPITSEDVNYLVSTQKGLFPGKKLNPKTIRQSVIANWLNERKIPLEQVQLMAGHKWISSSEMYRQTKLEEKREIINKFHPLNQIK